MHNISPIVLFTYNRPNHTEQTIEALKKNYLANQSDLFVFCDAPKSVNDEILVSNVRNYVKCINGFKSVTIFEQDQNIGLANSIISGVTSVIAQYGTVIVLEDDLVTSPFFLQYMNNALMFYRDKPRVMHISGWNYPIDSDQLGDSFLWRSMNCWGWATWEDRWCNFKKDTPYYIDSFTTERIQEFNLDGAYDFWAQMIDNQQQKIDTWAIFWYASIFERSGLCLNPSESYVKNIGIDGSGQNCGNNDYLSSRKQNNQLITNFPDDIEESKLAVSLISDFHLSHKKSTWKQLCLKFLVQIKHALSKKYDY